MHYIGIDVAKRRHCLSVIDEGGEMLVGCFSFNNSSAGYKVMLDRLDKEGIQKDNCMACLEATGHYGRLLKEHLNDSGIRYIDVNPLIIKRYRSISTIRKVKNDAIDSLVLAKWLRSERPEASSVPPQDTQELKAITQFRTFQIQIIGDCKRKVISLLDQTFPEYDPFFYDTFGPSSLAVLSRWQDANSLAKADIRTLTKVLSDASLGKLGRGKAEELRELARASFAVKQPRFAEGLQIRHLISQINFTKQRLEEIDGYLKDFLEKTNSPITTIPGIGIVCGATILGQLGDISRFGDASKIVAYAGLDPSTYESGELKGTRSHLSKRGSSLLRWALWLAADRSRLFDPTMEKYYLKKRSEGKSHKVAVSALARKLCNIIYAVLRDNKPYRVI